MDTGISLGLESVGSPAFGGAEQGEPRIGTALGPLHLVITVGCKNPALETTRVRQRIAIEIWSNYQDYICARTKFADPTPDKQRANEDEAVKTHLARGAERSGADAGARGVEVLTHHLDINP